LTGATICHYNFPRINTYNKASASVVDPEPLTGILSPLDATLKKLQRGVGLLLLTRNFRLDACSQFLQQRLAFAEPRPFPPLHIPRQRALFRLQLLEPLARLVSPVRGF